MRGGNRFIQDLRDNADDHELPWKSLRDEIALKVYKGD
jgi:hypothetical protein